MTTSNPAPVETPPDAAPAENMSATATATAPDVTPADSPSAGSTDVATEQIETDGSEAPSTSEAAAWRVQLREVEAETQALETTFAARLDAARRNHLEQMLTMTEPPEGQAEAVTFHDVADMWTIFGATPAQFYDDAGAFQPEALSAFLADAAAAERSYLTKTITRPVTPPIATIAAAEAAMTPQGHGARTSGSASPWADALH